MKRWIIALAGVVTLAGGTLAATAATTPREAGGMDELAAIEASIEALVDARLRELLPALREAR